MGSNQKMADGAVNREANVLLELCLLDPMSDELLDANAEAVLEAVLKHAGEIALGTALAVNAQSRTIKLRFDVLGKNDVDIYKRVSEVVATIVRETDLELVVSRSSVEAHTEADAPTGEFAAA